MSPSLSFSVNRSPTFPFQGEVKKHGKSLFTANPKHLNLSFRENPISTTTLTPHAVATEIPTHWYNIIADLPIKPPPFLHPKTFAPLQPQDLSHLFPDELIKQEISNERFIVIPDEVIDVYRLWRPTPLIRAKRLEKLLDTPARIYYKYEGVSPAGSHKPNTAVPQVWYNVQQGVKNIVTETGAGQWGCSLAFASSLFGLNCEVWQVRASYDQKPYRKLMMQTWGANVHPSPSNITESGRRILGMDPSSPGSLGIAISEAVEVAGLNEDTKYCLGSVLNHVLLHQTVIGEECIKQMEAVAAAVTTTSCRPILLPSLSSSLTTTLTLLFIRKHSPHHSRKLITTMAASSTPTPEKKTTAPYGSWSSPITSDVVSGASKGLGGTAVDSHGRLFWLESRPSESGRLVIVKGGNDENEEAIDVTPKEFSVRTVAQEYGGGAFSISGGTVVFSNYKDQRLYKQSLDSKDSAPVPLTPDYDGPLVSYADGVYDTSLERYITVREDRRGSSLDAITSIVSIELGDDGVKEPKVLVSGNDFYAFPRLDPEGKRLAWIEWSHPNMPWDRSELWVGYISDTGDVYKRVCIAGGDSAIIESPTEPKWSDEGELFFVTDRKSGFWNLHRWVESDNSVTPVYSLEAEFARPLWVFGMNSYEILMEHKNLIACSYRQKGRSYLGVVDKNKNTLSILQTPFTDLMNITSGVRCLYVEGASGVHPLSIAKVTLDDVASNVVDFKIVWSSSPSSSQYKSYFSSPEFIEFPTEVPGENAYAYYYPPTNPNYQSSQEEKPPLLLKSHGGPTAETRGILNLQVQFWTSRGWAFVDVNYGGSTGYGREFRERLLKQWGIVDVNDCCSCAQFLVECGKADGERLCITGGSAGGYTTLAALAFKKTFKAGASLYGVADLKLLEEETHKFESRYMDNLVGGEKEFFERSPINFVDQFSCPIILFQGLEDKVVPPDQAKKIYKALKAKGLPVALVEYEGEQHGFRKAENIKFTLEQQMVFFARLVGGFKVADEIVPIKIDNFD